MGEAATERPLTYEDLLAHDRDHGGRPELIDGRILYKAAPRFPHGQAQSRPSAPSIRSTRSPYYWLINPEARTLEAFRLHDKAWVLLGTFTDGDIANVPPFESLDLELSDLFLPR